MQSVSIDVTFARWSDFHTPLRVYVGKEELSNLPPDNQINIEQANTLIQTFLEKINALGITLPEPALKFASNLPVLEVGGLYSLQSRITDYIQGICNHSEGILSFSKFDQVEPD